jgi:hypothetical protein
MKFLDLREIPSCEPSALRDALDNTVCESFCHRLARYWISDETEQISTVDCDSDSVDHECNSALDDGPADPTFYEAEGDSDAEVELLGEPNGFFLLNTY